MSIDTLASAVSRVIIFCGVGGCFVRRLAHQVEHIRDVRDIFLARLLRGVAGAEVIIALGQTQAPLIDYGNLLSRVLEILLSPYPKNAFTLIIW